ncbi:MAG TPA: 16S rRNA (cytidine(1402)-2'-O)-methyltransferase [Candidatus Hydrogenedentes bacterium]|jgi:16S rRNA (cytidine1402-2'-O)-methyltransferase|nr:MAG: Ribosomal RNA small subunit methyltransferase I [Candidatus Hydrogenedentes bacterium ADurb.Bin170]HPX86353.1 16S rRNA (cytidine(1402)-2'-O)-methyltransferase [Candidatus Hydrogenedentota bacterium]HQB01779.1 16S rRNA (cytidine(1402)-2'-O)-methyltransferase [Candidatus Hydrogenedentota bacterium]
MSTLYVIGTPIGNLEDLSYRAVRILGEVDAIACEDTRITRKIYERFQIPSPAIRFSSHEHNEDQAAKRIIGLLREGRSVALCTDSGMPCISDPGYDAVNLCREAGFAVELVPGPSAVLTALVLSGLSGASFTFKGFPPRKEGKRKRFLEMEKDAPHTLIFFESPFRIAVLLRDALEVLGDREAAVCFELTKHHERVLRGPLSELYARFDGVPHPKGEITVVIAGNNPKFLHKDEPSEND